MSSVDACTLSVNRSPMYQPGSAPYWPYVEPSPSSSNERYGGSPFSIVVDEPAVLSSHWMSRSAREPMETKM